MVQRIFKYIIMFRNAKDINHFQVNNKDNLYVLNTYKKYKDLINIQVKSE